MTVAIVAAAILAVLVFGLGFNVSRLRGITAKAGGTQLPTDPSDRLFIAIRAHGNAAEYVPRDARRNALGSSGSNMLRTKSASATSSTCTKSSSSNCPPIARTHCSCSGEVAVPQIAYFRTRRV